MTLASKRSTSAAEPLLQNASRRFSAATLTTLAQLAYATDQAIKGQLREDPWQKCEQLVLGLCGTPLPQ